MNFYDILLARCLCCSSGEESGGGGGSSDFSTAQVTIVNNGSAEYEGTAVYIGSSPFGEVLDSVFYVDAGNSDTLTCVLYKGQALLSVNGWSVTLEGDAEADNNLVYITGDCTITLTDAA